MASRQNPLPKGRHSRTSSRLSVTNADARNNTRVRSVKDAIVRWLEAASEALSGRR